MDKPTPIEWVPISFALLAVIICETLLFAAYSGSEAAIQGAIAIANTLAGAAAGAYAGKSSKPSA